jgi:hypothetical protein
MMFDQACSAGSRSRSGRAYSGYQPSRSQPGGIPTLARALRHLRPGERPSFLPLTDREAAHESRGQRVDPPEIIDVHLS